MDFFEIFFHFSPDGGNGTAEMACIGLLVFFVAGLRFGVARPWFAKSLQRPGTLTMQWSRNWDDGTNPGVLYASSAKQR